MCKTILDFGEMILSTKHMSSIMVVMKNSLTSELNGQIKVILDLQNLGLANGHFPSHMYAPRILSPQLDNLLMRNLTNSLL